MKKYAIINGKDLHLVTALNMEKANHEAIKICDYSKEVIVREITELTIFGESQTVNTYKKENQIVPA